MKAGKLKRPQRYQPGIVALHKIHQFQKSTELQICELPFLCLVCKIAQEIGKFNMCTSRGVHHTDTAESCSVLSGQPPGRCQPQCPTCVMHIYNYAKGYTISPSYLWRSPPFLKLSSSQKSVFSLSVGCRLYRILLVQGKGMLLGITLCTFINNQGVSFYCY